MYDGGKIIAGLIIGMVLLTFPFWYNLGRAARFPEPQLAPEAKKAGQCVETKAYMAAHHMQLLNEWRNDVVRKRLRIYIGLNGKRFNMSLQNECMKCHTSKTQFCDRCHNFVDVQPYCWECHIAPKEAKKEGK